MALDKFLRENLKMTRLKTEHCIYVRFNENRSEYIILAVYADDLFIAGMTQKAITNFKQQITAKYVCKDIGALDRILKSITGGRIVSAPIAIYSGCTRKI